MFLGGIERDQCHVDKLEDIEKISFLYVLFVRTCITQKRQG